MKVTAHGQRNKAKTAKAVRSYRELGAEFSYDPIPAKFDISEEALHETLVTYRKLIATNTLNDYSSQVWHDSTYFYRYVRPTKRRKAMILKTIYFPVVRYSTLNTWYRLPSGHWARTA